MFAVAVAVATSFNGFLVGMAISGLGSVCTSLSTSPSSPTCYPKRDDVAKDLGVFNIAGALPFSIAPALAPLILLMGRGSYSVLFAVAGLCAILGAVAILRVRGVR